MSKYYKAEDVIRAIAEQLCWEARTEYGDKFTTEDWLEEAEDYVLDLPTIEVSEDCISRKMVAKRLAELWETEHPEKSYDEWLEIANKWCDYFPPSVVPQVPSEDNKAYTCCSRCGMRVVVDATSIVPICQKSRQVERAEGEWQITDAYPHNVYCSECHKKFAQTHWGVWEDGSLPRNYCPNCGAKMKGQSNERLIR